MSYAQATPSQTRIIEADGLPGKVKKHYQLDRATKSERLERRARSASQGPSSSAFVATVGGNQMQGLRSRRPSAHRRNADRDEDVAHPLRPSPSLSTVAVGALTDDTVTRPLLRRWLSQSEDTDLWNGDVSNGNTDGFDDGEAEANNESEVLVIEHTVSRSDSLAGVALKYGISLAELRRANQLWSTDTIHFRKILYIPLHAADKQYAELLLEKRTSNEEGPSRSTPSHHVKRIPSSQLAFFPPGSKVPSSKSTNSLETIRATNTDNVDPSRPFFPTISSRGISAFLNSIPIPSSEGLISRLSLDSDGTRANSSRSDVSSDQEHELQPIKPKVVSPNSSPHRQRRTPSTIRDKGDALMLLPVVQTEQMKPSPRMELPKSLRRPGS